MDEFLYRKLIDLLYHSVLSEGGDGDALWLSRHTSLEKIEELIKAYNEENNIGWKLERNEHRIAWGKDQEWVCILDNEEVFNNCPDWMVLKIRY